MDGDRTLRRGRITVGAVIVVVVVALAVAVVVGMIRTAVPASDVVPRATDPAVRAELYVHVEGAVRRPGLYRLDADARAMDVIGAAGGFAKDADRAVVNLARPVVDGEQILVPHVGESGQRAAADSADARIDLNTADLAALDTLPRIGPALAERILAWRDQNGRFTSVDDLLAVPGIGEKMMASLRDLVRV